jgi:hypothetical protein
MTCFKEIVWHILEGMEENNENPQHGLLTSGPRFKPGISRIRNRVANHCTETLDYYGYV